MPRLRRLFRFIAVVFALCLAWLIFTNLSYIGLMILGHRYWIPKGYCESRGTPTDRHMANDLLSSNSTWTDPFFSYHLTGRKSVKDSNLYVLVLVVSAVGNIADRQLFRTTFGSVRRHMNKSIRTMYVVGRTPNVSLQRLVQQESDVYGDVIQFDFLDSYRNLTLKIALAFSWAVSHTDAQFVVKVDDDNLFNADRLVEYTLSLPPAEATYLYSGFIWWRPIPIRRADNKWSVGEDEYPGVAYPSYAAGPGYTLSRQAAVQVMSKFKVARQLTMEDTFMGICAYLSCLSPVHSDKYVAREMGSYYDYCWYDESIVIHRPNPDLLLRYWSEKTQAIASGQERCHRWW